jgi:hypothetical protein
LTMLFKAIITIFTFGVKVILKSVDWSNSIFHLFRHAMSGLYSPKNDYILCFMFVFQGTSWSVYSLNGCRCLCRSCNWNWNGTTGSVSVRTVSLLHGNYDWESVQFFQVPRLLMRRYTHAHA